MGKINLDRDLANKQFLLSPLGRAAFLGTIFITLFFFLSLTDHTPPFLGTGSEGNHVSDGIYLTPEESYDFALRPPVLLFIVLVTGLVGSLEFIVEEFNKRDVPVLPYIPILAAVIYVAFLIIGIAFWPGIEFQGKAILDRPKTVWVGFIFQMCIVFSVTYFYCQPLFPKNFPRFINQKWELYIQNQWRFAQILLTVVLSGFLGTAIPLAAGNGSFGIQGTISLIGLLVTGPVAIILFIAVRVHNMEQEIRVNSRYNT
ncbi:hypothetical protein ACT4ML_15405 [Natrinema sp. LN54]|uniref:hypothetical protein n=1 Tax=Natrinema sp. LN54 TaxID=3458705 RepID=UPI004034FCD0